MLFDAAGLENPYALTACTVGVPAGCPATTGMVTSEWADAGTNIGHEPAPAETT